MKYLKSVIAGLLLVVCGFSTACGNIPNMYSDSESETKTGTESKPDIITNQKTYIGITTEPKTEELTEKVSLPEETFPKTKEPVTADSFVTDTDSLLQLSYLYTHMSGPEQMLYKQLQNAIRNHESTIKLAGSYTKEELQHVFNLYSQIDEYILCVGDPEVQIQYKIGNKIIDNVTFKYELSKEKADRYYQETMTEIDKITKNTEGLSPYEKELILYNAIVQRNTYNLNATSLHTAYAAMVIQESVCDGYAGAFKIACNRVGIPCDVVCGMACPDAGKPPESHAWNMVQLDGEYYIVDATFGDSFAEATNYAYFNISQQEADLTYELHSDFTNVPKATGTKYNYYIMNDSIAYSHSDFCRIVQEHMQTLGNGNICVQIKAQQPYDVSLIARNAPEQYFLFEIKESLGAYHCSVSETGNNTAVILFYQ